MNPPSYSSSSVGPLDVNTPPEKASGFEWSKLHPHWRRANVENVDPYASTLSAAIESFTSIPIRTLNRGSGTSFPFLEWLGTRLLRYRHDDLIADASAPTNFIVRNPNSSLYPGKKPGVSGTFG